MSATRLWKWKFLLCGAFFFQILHAAPSDYIVTQPVALNIAGKTVELSAGQSVNVLGIHNGMAMAKITLPDGGVALAQIAAAALQAAPAERTAPAPPPIPPVAPAQSGMPPAIPAPQAVTQKGPLLKPGWNTIQLEALPAPEQKPKWFRYNFDPAAEKFMVYIPSTYSPQKPCGILGWTNPSDGLGIPRQFAPLFDEFRLIAIAAERCGNKQESDRRAGLLVSAILQLSKTMAIDNRRVLLSGASGGGRLSALGGFVHPEIFCGAISWCGGNFYRDYPDSSKPGYVVYGISNAHKIDNAVTAQNVIAAKQNVKFVLLTGPKDFNRINSQDIEREMKKEHFQVLLIEEPELGHAVGSAATMRQALEFVLGAPPKL